MKITKKQQKSNERKEAIETLRLLLKPGKEVRTILRHVSTSGMTRDISLLVTDNTGDIVNITYLASLALEDRLVERFGHNAIRVTGCGMDMGFSLVYSLSRIIFPTGFIPADAGKAFGRNGTLSTDIDTDGGYALTHKWL